MRDARALLSACRAPHRRREPPRPSLLVAVAALLAQDPPPSPLIPHQSLCLWHRVPLITFTCAPQRAQAASRRERAPVIARGLVAPRATTRRGERQVSSLGVLGRVGERAHPGGRRQSEQRRAGARAAVLFPSWSDIRGARSGMAFRRIDDPETHLPSPKLTRPTIGMLNIPLRTP